MFKKSKKGYYFWEEFAKINGVIHGFSTRRFGDMNPKNSRSSKHLGNFLDRLGVDKENIVKMNQVHGNDVCFVSLQDRGNVIAKTDGLVAQEKGVFLTATFADCVPALFLDKNKKFFGIAHAGWRGVYKEIVKTVVEQMVKKGLNRSDIMVGIGPSIKVCCYNINTDREMIFKNKYPKMKKIIEKRDGKIFLNLSGIIKLQLISCGILSENIIDCRMCIKDNILDFFSFREEGGTESFGLCCGVIGRT